MASDAKKKKKKVKTQEDEWKFDESILEGCQLKKDYPNHFQPIKSILKAEKAKGKSSFDVQKALCLDSIEVERAKSEGRDQRSTTDLAIGITSTNGRANKKIRLVECKFDVNKNNRKVIEDLKDKNKKTRDFYDFGCPIREYFVVLLNDKFYQQGRRFIMEGFSNSLDCEVLTVNGFYEQYFKY